MRRIKIQLNPTSYGAISAEPVGEDARLKYADHMHEWTGHRDPRAFFQGDYELPELVRNNPRAMRELRAGWPTVILADPWEFGHWLGWDAHTVEI